MSHIASRSKAAMSKLDIVSIANDAKEDAAKGNRIINASIGTFFNDEKKLGDVPLVKKALSEHIGDSLGYPSVYGDKGFLQSVQSFLFGENEKAITGNFSIFSGTTIGGTGAITIAFNMFLEEGDSVLLPSVMWTNYMLIAKKAGLGHEEYNMFNEHDGLDIASIEKKIEERFAVNGSAFLVINDPCQNPTGYCMDEAEYDQLFFMLNKLGKKGKLTVVFDVAYSAFYAVPGHHFALFDELAKGKTSFLPLLAFSTSKLFGIYGLRVGALFALASSEEEANEISGSFAADARGTYSVPVGSPQVALARALNDPATIDELRQEIQRNADILSARSKQLLAAMEEYGVAHYPYMSGFFITIKVKDAYDLYQKLRERHMYVVPMNATSIRIAFGALTIEDGTELIKTISELQ